MKRNNNNKNCITIQIDMNFKFFFLHSIFFNRFFLSHHKSTVFKGMPNWNSIRSVLKCKKTEKNQIFRKFSQISNISIELNLNFMYWNQINSNKKLIHCRHFSLIQYNAKCSRFALLKCQTSKCVAVMKGKILPFFGMLSTCLTNKYLNETSRCYIATLFCIFANLIF